MNIDKISQNVNKKQVVKYIQDDTAHLKFTCTTVCLWLWSQGTFSRRIQMCTGDEQVPRGGAHRERQRGRAQGGDVGGSSRAHSSVLPQPRPEGRNAVPGSTL